MPLTDLDPNLGRQNSKSSRTSAKTANDAARPGPGTLAAPSGVLSMLRTGTETGDLGAFSMNSGRFPKLPHAVNRNPPHLPKNVTSSSTSSQYSRHNSLHGSIKSSKSQRSAHSARSARERPVPGEWPFSQYPFVGGQERPGTQSDTRSSVAQESVRSMPVSGHEHVELTARSHSLTHSVYPHGNPNMHRSTTSLRSHQDIVPRSRTPQAQGPRFPPPGYRPTSPALSDTAGAFYSRRPMMRPPPGPRSFTTSPGPQSYGFQGQQRPMVPNGPRPSRTIEELRRPFLNAQSSQAFLMADECYPPPASRRPPPYIGGRGDDYSPAVPSRLPYGSSATEGSMRELHHPIPQTVNPDPAPYMGFVQRVKNALEERSTQHLPKISQRSETPSPDLELGRGSGLLNGSNIEQEDSPGTPVMELRQDQRTADFANNVDDKHPEFDWKPVEEDSAPETPTVKRLTRDLIKAGMDAMSDVVATSDAPDEASPESVNCEVDSAMTKSIRNSFSSQEQDFQDIAQKKTAVEEADDVPICKTSAMIDRMPDEEPPYDPPLAPAHVPSSPPLPWNSTQQVDDSTQNMARDVNRRTFPFDSETTLSLSRPLSMPIDYTRNVFADNIDEQRQKHAMPGRLEEARSSSPIQKTEDDDKQHTISTANPGSSRQTPAASSDPVRQSENATLTSNFDGPTRVTILPSSPTTSINILDDQSNYDHRRMRSSLGTVPESELEPYTTSTGASDATDTPSTRLLFRNGAPSDSARRSANNEVGSSAMKSFQFPLPDLAEDSQEDASTTNLRMLGNKHPNFRGRGGLKDFRRNPAPRQLPRQLPVPEPPKSYFSRGLGNSHNLPSFNFSHTDLTAKLNAALGLRNSRSLEDLTTSKPDTRSLVTVPERPQSSKSMIHDRYRSFFILDNHSSEEVDSKQAPPPPSTTRLTVPEDRLLNEIEQLSIPSVKHLSLRLSQIFPTIRSSRTDIDLDKVDEALTRTVQEIRGINSSKRVKSVDATFDDSAGETMSSPLARRETIASSRSAAPKGQALDRKYLRLNKDLPPLPKISRKEDGSNDSGSEGYESARASQESTDEAESDNEESDHKDSPEGKGRGSLGKAEGKGSKRKKKRSRPLLRGSSETVPQLWDKSEGYPWSDGTQTADVTLSTNAPDITASTEEKPRHRGRSRSSPEAPRDNTLRVIRSMSPGFDADLVPKSEAVEYSRPEASSAKQGVFRSISKKKEKENRMDRSEAAIDPRFFHPEEQQHRRSAVVPGDRYPTSSLGPPPGISIDESRSYFSDDSSDDEHGQGKRRRFTKLKGKRSMPVVGSHEPSGVDNRSDLRRTPNQESMVFVDAPHGPADESTQHKPPGGMSKAEFHAKRFVEKLRFLIFRSGEALKSIGKYRRRDAGMQDGGEGYPGT